MGDDSRNKGQERDEQGRDSDGGGDGRQPRDESTQDGESDDGGGNKCPECGEPVEEVRATCPNCGYEYKDEDYSDPDAGKEFIAGAAVDEEGNERPEKMEEIEDRIAAEKGSEDGDGEDRSEGGEEPEQNKGASQDPSARDE